MTAQEQDSPLAAMITAVAEGKPLTALQQAHMRVLTVDEAVRRGVTWAAIAALFGYPSVKEARKVIRDLRGRVQRELMLAERNR